MFLLLLYIHLVYKEYVATADEYNYYQVSNPSRADVLYYDPDMNRFYEIPPYQQRVFIPQTNNPQQEYNFEPHHFYQPYFPRNQPTDQNWSSGQVPPQQFVPQQQTPKIQVPPTERPSFFQYSSPPTPKLISTTPRFNNTRQQQTNHKLNSKYVQNFDIPPPPSRFLQASEKIRVNELIRQSHLQNRTSPAQVAHGREGTEEKFEDNVNVEEESKMPEKSKKINQSRQSIVVLDAKNPNEVFLDCCKRKQVHKRCESRCNFDILNKKVLTGMFLGIDKCPMEHGLDLFSCAAQEKDHTECCRSKSVQRTGAGEKCLSFCNLAPTAEKFQADASFLPCWTVLNEVKSCFKESILKSLKNQRSSAIRNH